MKPKPDAIPTIFPDYPSSSQPINVPTPKRTNYSERKNEIANNMNTEFMDNFLLSDKITSPDADFRDINMSTGDPSYFWTIINRNPNRIIFGYIDISNYPPVIKRSIVLDWVDTDMGFAVTPFAEKLSIPSSTYKHLLTKNLVTCKSQLENLLTFVRNYTFDHTSDSAGDDISRKQEFLQEQLDLMVKPASQRR